MFYVIRFRLEIASFIKQLHSASNSVKTVKQNKSIQTILQKSKRKNNWNKSLR